MNLVDHNRSDWWEVFVSVPKLHEGNRVFYQVIQWWPVPLASLKGRGGVVGLVVRETREVVWVLSLKDGFNLSNLEHDEKIDSIWFNVSFCDRLLFGPEYNQFRNSITRTYKQGCGLSWCFFNALETPERDTSSTHNSMPLRNHRQWGARCIILQDNMQWSSECLWWCLLFSQLRQYIIRACVW